MKEIASWLEQAGSAYALTGAGVSTDSGIPDFRGEDGLWAELDPMEVASSRALHENPRDFFEFWVDRFSSLKEASPNITHRTLEELESAGLLTGVITQNIDGLHAEAGSEKVYQLHGNFRFSRCEGCGKELPTAEILHRFRGGELPYCTDCGELIRPEVVLFGEQLPEEVTEAEKELARADLLLVLGSSLEVYPVASLVPHFESTGGRLVIINLDRTPYDRRADLVHHGELAAAMKALREKMGSL